MEVTTVNGPLKATASIGVIGLERLGNPTANAVLLAQNLSFATPGKASAVGGVLGTRVNIARRRMSACSPQAKASS